MKSSKARKQRKAFFNAPLHQRRKQIAAHLEENLLLKYDKRRLPVVRGDTVKVMRGAFKGHENKVANVQLKKHLVEVEGITVTKADGKQIAKSVHPSNLLITKLNLTDKWRRQRLEEGLSSETRKEIEQEATDQMKQIEEERRAEEQRRKEEEEASQKEEEESVEEVIPKETAEPETPTKKEKEVVEKKEQKVTPSQKKSESKKEPKKAEESKKVAKSTPSKKKKTEKESKGKKEEKSEKKEEEKQ